MQETNDVILEGESTIKSVIGKNGKVVNSRTAPDCIHTGYQQNMQNVQRIRLTSCMAVCTRNVQSPLTAPQPSGDVPMDADFICGKTDVLSKTTKETPYILLMINNF